MKRISSTALAGLVFFVAPGLTHAQRALAPGTELHEFQSPVQRVKLDLETGRLTRLGSRKPTRPQLAGRRGMVQSFQNTITTGYFWSGILGASAIDWSDKATGHHAVGHFEFAYATYAMDPAGGPLGRGPGAELVVSFHRGTTGWCVRGTDLPHFRFQGLPGVTGCMVAGSGFAYTVTAVLGSSAFSLPDGMIGWGYSFVQDRGLSMNLPPNGRSATGPLTTNFGTHVTSGWDDAFDLWIAGPGSWGSCTGTFWFGGCNTTDVTYPVDPNCASFYMALGEWDEAPTVSEYNGTGVNPVHFDQLGDGPRIGLPWLVTVDVAPAPVSFVAISTTAISPVPLGSQFNDTELLVDIGQLVERIRMRVGGNHTIPVPCDPSLIGASFAAQAGKWPVAGHPQLTNALLLTVGA